MVMVYARCDMAADVVEVDILRGNRIRRKDEESDKADSQALEFRRQESSLKFRMGRESSRYFQGRESIFKFVSLRSSGRPLTPK